MSGIAELIAKAAAEKQRDEARAERDTAIRQRDDWKAMTFRALDDKKSARVSAIKERDEARADVAKLREQLSQPDGKIIYVHRAVSLPGKFASEVPRKHIGGMPMDHCQLR